MAVAVAKAFDVCPLGKEGLPPLDILFIAE